MAGNQSYINKVTLTLDGPFASETEKSPNPFTDYNMSVRFTHESVSPDYIVLAFFAADGKSIQESSISIETANCGILVFSLRHVEQVIAVFMKW